MSGNRQAYKDRGIIPRMLSELFVQLAAAPQVGSWKMTISYLELYNESLFDLLVSHGGVMACAMPRDLCRMDGCAGHSSRPCCARTAAAFSLSSEAAGPM